MIFINVSESHRKLTKDNPIQTDVQLCSISDNESGDFVQFGILGFARQPHAMYIERYSIEYLLGI